MLGLLNSRPRNVIKTWWLRLWKFFFFVSVTFLYFSIPLVVNYICFYILVIKSYQTRKYVFIWQGGSKKSRGIYFLSCNLHLTWWIKAKTVVQQPTDFILQIKQVTAVLKGISSCRISSKKYIYMNLVHLLQICG